MTEKVDYIAKCKKLIEEKLVWGESENWQSQDFENLSEKIFEETSVMLSSSTLKRIWGKVRYESTPNTTTLNALVQFIGYENWRAFTANNFENSKPYSEDKAKTIGKSPYKLIIAICGVVIVIILMSLFASKKNAKRLHFEALKFTSKPVTSGLPNTVIFQYNASKSNADSVFIQQSWDSKKRFKVDKNLHEYTSTYYYPGYYRAKLILDDSIVKEHDIYIETNGWLGIIEKKPIPVYLPGNQLMIRKEDLLKLKIDIQKEAPIVSFTKVSKDINLSGDNFSLYAELQNTYDENNAICQYTSVRILGTGGVIDIPLCKMGCIGEVGLMLGMKYIDGTTHDLSGFGVDFTKVVKLTCETKNRNIKITVNDKVAFADKFAQSIGKIVGIQFKFNGTGIVKQFALGVSK